MQLRLFSNQHRERIVDARLEVAVEGPGEFPIFLYELFGVASELWHAHRLHRSYIPNRSSYIYVDHTATASRKKLRRVRRFRASNHPDLRLVRKDGIHVHSRLGLRFRIVVQVPGRLRNDCFSLVAKVGLGSAWR